MFAVIFEFIQECSVVFNISGEKGCFCNDYKEY